MTRPAPVWAKTPDGKKYFTISDITWYLGYKNSPWVVLVKRGFIFDISVPRWLRWLVSPDDETLLGPAAIHDWLLQDGWKRNRAAIEFYQACRAWGVPRWRAFILAGAVLTWTTWIGR